MEFKRDFRSSYDRNRFQDKKKFFGPRKNEYIRVPQVMLIDESGNNLGVTKTDEAIRLAQAKGLDLVEVGATATPTVCKIIDFAKYMYEQNKKQRKSKNKSKPMKEFQFSPVIEQGDIDTRVRRSKEFLGKGHMVRLTMVRKGRQTHEQAVQVFNGILTIK